MRIDFAVLAVCAPLIFFSPVAHADECEQLRKSVAAAKSALRDCLASGGSCGDKFTDVETATLRAGGCADAAPSVTSDCDRRKAEVESTKAALRTCIAGGGDCSAQFKAAESALADDACSDATAAPPGATPAPAVAGAAGAWSTVAINGVVVLSDGTIVHGDLLTGADGIGLNTSAGRIVLPLSRIRRIEFGPQMPGPPVAAVPAPPAATPRSFLGRFEVGGGISLSSFNYQTKLEGNGSHSSSTQISISPFVGYFNTEHFEFLGNAVLSRGASNYSDDSGLTTSRFSIGAGGNYLAQSDENLYIGPYFFVNYGVITDTSSDGAGTTTTFEYGGPGGVFGGIAKVIVGNAGVLSVSAAGFINAYDVKASQGSLHASGTESDSGFQALLSYSVIF